ncbi:hypothetical protein [Thiomicrorhabdus sp. 6S3-12]|uniref:hypothetical protein n=1 Tax=Thiomicrorhabdus sp. 6S3-12 TaxID=2819681 RepID=UPI001AAE0DC9|nr:hypothetical protein [Thiomicrorhabdus sp. 6S3-12]MBO1923465.1 hypothetical protein [Thiomicrorhabdus sp. 6S3-12]
MPEITSSLPLLMANLFLAIPVFLIRFICTAQRASATRNGNSMQAFKSPLQVNMLLDGYFSLFSSNASFRLLLLFEE